MSIWYLPSSLAMGAALLSDLEEASRSRRVRTFHALKVIFLLFLPLLKVGLPAVAGSRFWFQDELSLGLLLSPLPSCEGEQCYTEEDSPDAQWKT